MAWIRKLPSGRWAATVYTPLGDRVTESHESKGFVVAWAKKMEASKEDGSFIDPRKGKITVGEIWDLHADDRRLEMASQKRDASHYKNWVEETWGKRPVGPIRRQDVTSWVSDMEEAGAKGWTQTGALNVLRSMLEIAIDLGAIRSNPCAGVKVIPPEAHEDRVLEDFEDDLLLTNLAARFPGEPEAALFVEMLLYTGVRWQELAALRKEAVRPRERGFWVERVRERDGSDREYGKTASAHRFVAVDDDLWPRFAEHLLSVDPDVCDGDLFRSLGGKGKPRGKLIYDAWRDRIWAKGLLRVVPWTPEQIAAWKAQRNKYDSKTNLFEEVPILENPQPTPHDCRHTFGTRCAEEGMPRHEIAATMGHSPKGNAVDRYLHARNKRLERVRASMATVRGRRSPGRPGAGTCVHCGQKLPVSYDLEKVR